MNKQKADNIILLMSAGVGSRFGADKPKQYCLMNGKPIIEYALSACKNATSVDEVVIVTSLDYKDSVHEKYGFPTTVGGSNRTESLANGLQYVADNYICKKVIIANAVCPLIVSEQIDRYFSMLDEYDYVLTSWKVVSTLARYDGELVDRNDYFHVMEPEAYRFELLYQNYKKDYPVPYIFHQLPPESKGYHCFDYPYTMKITYSTDVKIAELLYDEIIGKNINEKAKHNIASRLSTFRPNDNIQSWLLKIPGYVNELVNKWGLYSYKISPDSYTTCVFEGISHTYGDVYVKIYSPSYRYEYEKAYYQLASKEYMAELYDFDDEYKALLIKKIVPGMQVKFDLQDTRLRTFFDKIDKNMIPAELVNKDICFPTILSEFEEGRNRADEFSFENDKRKLLNECALKVWTKYFEQAEQYFLHRDLHRRNLLRYMDTICAIDPLGVIGPKEFEYTISFVIEAKAHKEEVRSSYNDLLDFYSEYCHTDRLKAAVFIMWVHKLNEYVYTRTDGFETAKWTLNVIEDLFYDDFIKNAE